jgi:mRNA deadenylase 3'-5' endonuclease subunit Ccr4
MALPSLARAKKSLAIRVASFNGLADCYAHPQSFPKVATEHLRWQHRCPLLLGILESFAASDCDFISLQEIDADHLDSVWRPTLKKLGYDFVYHQKPDRRQDGCLLAWQSKQWQLLRHENLSFDDAVPGGPLAAQFNQKNVALIAALQECSTTTAGAAPRQLVIADAHLFWNPARPDIKLLQATVLCQAVERFRAALIQQQRQQQQQQPAVIICGDMNSLPGSAVYRLFTEGAASVDDDDNSSNSSGSTTTAAGTAVTSSGEPRFMCDATLNRFCRWLRMLGLDTEIETTDEEFARAEGRGLPVVDRYCSPTISTNCKAGSSSLIKPCTWQRFSALIADIASTILCA